MNSKIIEEDIENISKSISEDSKALNGKTLLITGGAGFLGNYFIGVIDFLNKNVLDEPCKIISVDNFVTGVKYRVEEGDHFRSIKHDVKNPLEIHENVDYIIHAAGIASPKFYRELKLETMDVATMGTRNMLDLAKEKNVKSMIFFSSSEVYGDPDPNYIPTPETYNGNVPSMGPRANYDESKRLGETYCAVYFDLYKVPVKIIRPFNVYGPGMRLDDYRVIPNFFSKLFKGESIPVYGAGNHTRTFCYITDAITGFYKILLSDWNGEAFNVGTDGPEISIEYLANLIVKLFDNDIKIENIEGLNEVYSKGDPTRRCPDLTKLKTKTNYKPKVSLEEGLKRFKDWAEGIIDE